MDSGNSGSMQSSSGGDEEYDSRTESMSTFLNSSAHVAHMSNPHLPPSSSHHHSHPSSSSSLFDPLSNYLDAFSRTPPTPNANSLLNLDMVWPRGPRSDPICTDIGGIMGSSSLSQPVTGGPFPGSSSMPSQPGAKNGVRPSPPSDQTNAVRNSKKRSRASRRAPTTVLTTDTSNFRAMVQEFTGIPAPPFSASPFPRSRLDLFSTASSMRSALDPAPPPYLLRPFAQKFQPPLFVSSSSSSSPSFPSSSLAEAIASTNNIAAATANTAGATTTTTTTTSNTSKATSTNNYHLLSDMGLPEQSQNLLNLHNPILTFQSLLQSSPPPPPRPNVPIFGSNSQGSLAVPSTDSQLKMGVVLEEFGMGHGQVNAHLSGLSNLVTSDGMSLRSDTNLSSWGDGVGLNDREQAHLKSFNGNYGNSQPASSCKMNYSTTRPSDFQVEKGSENVSSRGKGLMDSWICSSE